MHKQRKRAAFYHLKKEKKLHQWRHLARQLLKGEITLPQMERIAGPSKNGVLKTAAYVSAREALTPPALVVQAMTYAIAPALAGSGHLPKPAMSRAVAVAPAASVAAAPAAASAEHVPVHTARARSAAAKPAPATKAKPASRLRAVAKKADEKAATPRRAPARRRTTKGE